MTASVRVILGVVVFLLWGGLTALRAQSYPYDVDTRPPRGIMPTSDQLTAPLDSIDNTTGKLHLEVPLASLPVGNGGSGFELSLVYDSELYDTRPVEGTIFVGGQPVDIIAEERTSQFTTGGWNYNFENYRLEAETRFVPTWAIGCTHPSMLYQEHERIYRYRIGLPDGSLHTLHLRGFEDPNESSYWADGFYGVNADGKRSPCAAEAPNRYPSNVTGTLVYYTTDGSYLRLEIPADGSLWYEKLWTLYFPDGRRVTGKGGQVQAIYDANTFTGHSNPADATEGNRIYFERTGGSQPVTRIRDDYGREIVIEKYYTSNPRQDRITVQGPNDAMEWRVNWTTFQIGDAQNPSYVCYYDAQTNTDYLCPWNASHTAVKYIQLPLERAANPAAPFTVPPTPWNSYEFDYSVNGPQKGSGELVYMRIPSGAEYRYSEGLGLLRQRDITADGVTLTWKWEPAGGNKVRMTAPDGGQTTYWHYPIWMMSDWKRGLTYRIEMPQGRIVKRQWTRNKVAALADEANKDPNNPLVERESVTEAGQLSAVTEYAYDKNGNLLRRIERDWTAYNGQTEAVETGGPILRKTEMTYWVDVPGSSDIGEGSQKYWQSGSPRRLDAMQRREVGDGSTVIAVTEYQYDDPLKSGNVRFERRWDDTKAPTVPGLGQLDTPNSVVFRRDYDPSGNGNLTEIYEPAVHTRLTYTGGPRPSWIEYAPETAAFRSTAYSWNLAAGTLNSQTDEQTGMTTTHEYDAAGRVKLTTEAGMRRTETAYDDASRTVTVKKDWAVLGDGELQTITRYDQLGRVDLLRTSDGSALLPGGSNGVKVKTAYRMSAGGLHVITSTPYRELSDQTLEWTCTQHDQLGRVIAVAMFKGESQPTDCQVSANRTGIAQTTYVVDSGMARSRVIDPAGKGTDHYRDGAGRLVRVTEDPGGFAYVTAYSYDPLDNLTSVTPVGGAQQSRVFSYTSLGRMKSAANPESGVIQYEYYDGGDLKTRTDARGYTVTQTYDGLHRVTEKSYSNDGDVTPDVTYQYYGSGPCTGLLNVTFSSASTTRNTSCDNLGRILAQSQEMPGSAPYTLQYSYWLNGSLKTLQYPSGKIVNYDVDKAGRTIRVSGSSKTYADLTLSSSPAYAPDGRVARLKLGNELWELRDYRTPGTPTSLKWGTSEGAGDRLTLQYNFDATANNGNVVSQIIQHSGQTWNQKYEYDALDRLTCVAEATTPPGDPCTQGNWRRLYDYDRYGNRWVSGTVGLTGTDVHEPTASTLFQVSTNRLQNSAYDAAGNQTFYTPYTLGYDAENRIISVSSTTNGSGTFAYDGDGRRIAKVWNSSAGTTTHLYVYDLAGRLAAEYSTRAATPGTAYIHADLLGSVRMVTGEKPASWPAQSAAILECYDYLPFGRLLNSGDFQRNTGCYPPSPDTQIDSRVPQKFTGHLRDSETRLDFFGARYFSAAQGRFTSADAPFADQHPENPQSWNLYQYGYNNPLNNIDRNGRSVWTKALKFALKGGDIALTVDGVITDFKTASNVDLPWSTRIMANLSIMSEFLPVSAGDLKDAGRILGMVDRTENVGDVLRHAGDVQVPPKGATIVIGRVKDLHDLKPGEASLLGLPDLGNARDNWRKNSGLLRQEMRRGQPIRDASPGDNGGQFLNAERGLLRDRGWTFDSDTNLWIPPSAAVTHVNE